VAPAKRPLASINAHKRFIIPGAGVNYAGAVAACKSLASDLAQPFNELESLTVSVVLSNFTTNMTSTSFWIGKQFLLIRRNNI
jgi:hypothetical protein